MEWRNEPSAALADVCSPLETTVPAPDRKPPIGFDDHHRAKQHDRPICSPLVTTVPTPDRKPPIGFDDHHRAKQHDRPICSTSLKYIGAREGPKVCRLSPLEGDGFELSVPRERGYRPELSSVIYVPENVSFCRTNIRSRPRWRLLSSCTRTPNGRLATGGGLDSLSAALTSRE
jgi:hypothetical protein